MNAKLAECLKKLRLSGMAQTLAVRLQEAAANGSSSSRDRSFTGPEIPT